MMALQIDERRMGDHRAAAAEQAAREGSDQRGGVDAIVWRFRWNPPEPNCGRPLSAGDRGSPVAIVAINIVMPLPSAITPPNRLLNDQVYEDLARKVALRCV
jgi:hypothetical protein